MKFKLPLKATIKSNNSISILLLSLLILVVINLLIMENNYINYILTYLIINNILNFLIKPFIHINLEKNDIIESIYISDADNKITTFLFKKRVDINSTILRLFFPNILSYERYELTKSSFYIEDIENVDDNIREVLESNII